MSSPTTIGIHDNLSSCQPSIPLCMQFYVIFFPCSGKLNSQTLVQHDGLFPLYLNIKFLPLAHQQQSFQMVEDGKWFHQSTSILVSLPAYTMHVIQDIILILKSFVYWLQQTLMILSFNCLRISSSEMSSECCTLIKTVCTLRGLQAPPTISYSAVT